MTHIRVDIHLPLKFNPEESGKEISQEIFFQTYEELLKLAGGISTNNNPLNGSWINPLSNVRYDDKTITFTIVVESEDRMTINQIPKIRE